MKSLSHWAKANRKKTWAFIAIAKVLVAFITFLFASLLFVCDYYIPSSVVLLAILIVSFVFAFYPIKEYKKGWYSYSYKKQKRFDGLLLLGEFLLLLCFFQQQLMPAPIDNIEAKASFIVLQDVDKKINEKPRENWKQQFKEGKRKLKKELKKLRQILKKENSLSISVAKFLLGLFLILGVLALGVLIAYISCNLSCNGYGALAVAVLVVGWGGLIAALIFGIRRIARMKFDKVPKELQTKDEKLEGEATEEKQELEQ